jgi:hypothetical protein
MYKYTDLEYEMQMMDEMIESEMYKVKGLIQDKFNSYFAHFANLTEDLLLTIAYGYWGSYQHAEKVADQLNLGKLEFLAIAEDFDGFKEEYLKHYEEAQNF